MSPVHLHAGREETPAETALREAETYCRRLTREHYENFSVVNFLLPIRLRQHFCNIYAYCRRADDLADKSSSPERATHLLLGWREELHRCYEGRAQHPVFLALEKTIQQFEVPVEPFDELLEAFLQDQVKTRYETWDELLGYCRRSANPVGHLVLFLFRYRDPHRQALADFTCTGLQLANFWQDVRPDLKRGRIYIPREEMARFGYSEEELLERRITPGFRRTLEFLVERTGDLFKQGRSLAPLLQGRARPYVRLFSDCGELLLSRIRNMDFDVLNGRPTLSRWDRFRLLSVAVGKELVGG